MEISGIQSGMGFNFQASEKSAPANRTATLADTVNLQGVQVLADDEVEAVYNDTVNMIGTDAGQALSAHAGLSESRVFALLGM